MSLAKSSSRIQISYSMRIRSDTTPDLLDLPRFGSFNIHFFFTKIQRSKSVQASILAGDSTTGISIQKMVMKLDAGPILSESKPIKILESDTSRTLGEKLSVHSQNLLLDSIDQIPS